MNHFLTVNGLEAPLLRQFGCDCNRCVGARRQANTSVSFVSVDDAGKTAQHVLFDVGQGVVDSLVCNPHLQGSRARLDWLCLTHWHPDHTLGLNQLLVSYHHNRRRRGEEPTPVPLWCRSGTARWLEQEHAYDLTYADVRESGEGAPPGRVLAPIPIDVPGVTVTPVTIAHFNGDRCAANRDETCYCCAAFVVQTAQAKAVLLWDLDTENEWLLRPGPSQRAAAQLLHNADFLFIDTAFWQAKEHRTSHPSFTNVQRIAQALRPQETLLVHLSGHPDGRGNPGFGWTNERWETEAQEVWAEKTLPGRVRVPHIGQTFAL